MQSDGDATPDSETQGTHITAPPYHFPTNASNTTEPFIPISLTADAWDDTVLIEAFNRATKSYRSKGDPPIKKTRKRARRHTLDHPVQHAHKNHAENGVGSTEDPHVRSDVVQGERQRARRISLPAPPECNVGVHKTFEALPNGVPYVNDTARNSAIHIPPPPAPPHISGDLQKLLLSWYEAGYRTGLEVGRMNR